MVARDTCPGCEGQGVVSLYRCAYDEEPLRGYLQRFYLPQGGVEVEYLRGADYHLVRCPACGLVYQREVPGDDLMLRLYERWIDPDLAFRRHLDDAGLPMYAQYAQELMRLLAWFERRPSSIDVLDFGMGWGRWARMAKAFGCNVWGAELSPRRIEYAARHGIEALAWEEIPNRAFDLINTDQVFEHIPDPLVALRHLVRALKPGGLVKLSVPDGTTILERLKAMDWEAPVTSPNSLHAVAPLEHINCFSRASLVHMAALAGLEPAPMPLRLQYQFAANWSSLSAARRNLLLPIWHNLLGRGTYLFFRLAGSRSQAGLNSA